jgi:hypothetical protein
MKKYVFILIFCLFIGLSPVLAQRGCCSHHGGVSGCSSYGRQVCNDGTLSPTCTCESAVAVIKGCTNSSAINYNSSANKDDGSCKYKVIKKDYEDIPYETTYEEDGTLNNGDEVVATEGNNGIRTITYELIVDSNNKELNRNEVDSTITTPVVNKVIKRNTNSVATDEEVVPVEETDDSQITTNNDAKETKEPTASDTVCGLIGLTILIGGPIFLIRKIFKK